MILVYAYELSIALMTHCNFYADLQCDQPVHDTWRITASRNAGSIERL